MALKGLTEMTRKLENLLGEIPEKIQQKVLKKVALGCLGEAMMKAPVETGHLRESGYCEFDGIKVAGGSKDGQQLQLLGEPPAPSSDKITAKIGFNATTPDGKYSYALIQHERTDFNHPIGGEAKYLEKAMDETATKLRNQLSQALGQELR